MNHHAPVHRFEIALRPGRLDARAERLLREARALGMHPREIRAARVYFIQAALSPDQLQRVGRGLLADPVVEGFVLGASAPAGESVVEVHPLPGVMDPAAQSVREAVVELLGLRDASDSGLMVSTGVRFDVHGLDQARARELISKVVANPVVHAVHDKPWTPESLPVGHEAPMRVRHVKICGLSDAELESLSRSAHLFLSLDEMRAIRDEFEKLGREPTDIEVETIAQTWSEHCVHKTLKSRVVYRGAGDRNGPQQGPGAPRPDSRERPTDRVGFTFSSTGSSTGSSSGSSSGKAGGSPQGAHVGARPHADPLDFAGRPGHQILSDGTVVIDNLLKSTVAAATFELIDEGVDWALSVFKDNSGVVALDDNWGVCIKVETHNHPSAIEPYGGSATGIGGCIRDVIGTGLGAKPIASTDVFCVASPALTGVPAGVIPPRRVLTDVVAGVRDYGNRMGIPTVNGGVFFDNRYVGNPLVFCGCVGLIPRDKIHGKPGAGDLIVALGGRTGRDGIHGATFSSAELTDTHADEFAHAVQIGNAIEEKRVLDAILRARDASSLTGTPTGGHAGSLYTAMTDCGAGGFSSAVGEMGKDLGAEVDLDRAPLKYAGLTYAEIWISEAQERMVLSVPPANLAALQRICDEERVELAVLGTFGTPNKELVLRYRGTEVARMPMDFLHEGIPMPTREASWDPGDILEAGEMSGVTFASSLVASTVDSNRSSASSAGASTPLSVSAMLPALLSHPTIASKRWIIRQYDHEVQGNVVVKPLVGPGGDGPGDAAVLEPVPGTGRGIAIGCGMQTPVGDVHLPSLFGDSAARARAGLEVESGDPYLMALAAIDECVRNLVCVGADPRRIAILDNFSWASCKKSENLAGLVRAAEGCYDGAKAYRTPFVSGKDSLNNQFTMKDPATGQTRTIEIPPTLLITGLGIVQNVQRAITMDAKRAGNLLVIVGATEGKLGASLMQQMMSREFTGTGNAGRATASETMARLSDRDFSIPRVDLSTGPRTAQAIHELIRQGLARSVHDCSEGGLLVAAAEMLIAALPDDDPSQVQSSASKQADGSSSRGLGSVSGQEAGQDLASLLGKPASSGASSSVGSGSTGANPIADLVASIARGGKPATASGSVASDARGGASNHASGRELGLSMTLTHDLLEPLELAFAESPSRYIVEIAPTDLERLKGVLRDHGGLPWATLGTLNTTGRLNWPWADVDASVRDLRRAWLATLDW
ncbi:MAG: AIR synthase-related protein [Planctomycetota bacterium]|nr:AIR synthase-related protein [Planctomycetota bacterium]